MSRREWSSAVRFGLPGVLIGLALAWCGGGRGLPSALGQQVPPVGRSAVPAPVPAQMTARSPDNSGTIALTSTHPQDGSQWLYLIDTKTQALAVYRIDTVDAGKLKLVAARKYRSDLMLTEFNNLAPQVEAIESIVQAGAAANR